MIHPVVVFGAWVWSSADSGPEKPENPNIENETRQTRTRKIVKIPKPDKPEPENETRGYPMYFYSQKTGKVKLFTSKLISRKMSAFLVPAFMKAKDWLVMLSQFRSPLKLRTVG